MQAAKDITIIPPIGSDGVTYALGQGAAATNIIEITLSGATFKAATSYSVCNAAVLIAGPATPGAVATFNFQVVAAAASAVVLNLTDAGCAALDQNTLLRASAASAAGSATIRFRLMNGVIELDTSGTAATTLATIRSEYTASVNNSNHVVDVAVASGADGTKFTVGTGTASNGLAGSPIVVASPNTAGVTNSIRIATLGNDVSDAALTTTATVTVAGDFTGISKIFLADGAGVCDSTATAPVANNRVQSATNPTSPVSLLIPAAQFAATVPAPGVGVTTNVDFLLCALVNGTTFENPRTLTASVDISVTGTGANDPAATAAFPVQTWTLNGADVRVTGVKGGTANETTLSFNNLGSTTGTIRRLEVYRTAATAGATTPACVVTNIPGSDFSLWANGGNTILANGLIATKCAASASFVSGASAESYGLRLVFDILQGNLGGQATRNIIGTGLVNLPILKGGPGIATFATE
jgi:hypothetical protein